MQHAAFFPFQNIARASPHERRALAAALAVSVVAHVALLTLIVMPERDAPPPPSVLEVTIVEPPRPKPIVEPPRQIVSPKPAPEPRIRPRPAARTDTAPARQPAPSREAAPVLSLPSDNPALPSFTVPQATVPQATAEPRPAAAEAKAATGPREASPSAAVPTTAASFDAAYLRNEPPRYPLVARRNGIEGRVNLKVVVTRDGRAAQVQVHESSGSSALDSAAIEAVRKWQFVPARRGQDTIESSVIVPIVFRLENAS
jgi:protein TonB